MSDRWRRRPRLRSFVFGSVVGGLVAVAAQGGWDGG
jgi:hypothetical protein